MLKEFAVDILRLDKVATVSNAQRRPEETSDASGIIPPSHASAMLKLFKCGSPRTRVGYFASYSMAACGGIERCDFFFLGKELQECIRLACYCIN